MATPKKASDATADPSAPEEKAALRREPAPAILFTRPIVLSKRKKKKRKKRYTKGFKDVQRLSHGVLESSEQLYQGGRKTVRTLRKRSDRSARKRRDGALKDLPDNLGRALQDGLEASARAPYELLRQVNSKRVWKQTRPLVQAAYGIAYPLNSFFR